MRGPLLGCLLLFFAVGAISQVQPLTVGDFQSLTTLSDKNTSKLLDQKGFRTAGSLYINGFSEYIYAPRKKENNDSAFRSVSDFSRQSNSSFTYKTSSTEEYDGIVKQLQDAGFWQTIGDDGNSLFFQKKDFSITSSQELEDSMTIFKFTVVRSFLPDISGIQYAEDLTHYNSHENLVYTFGDKNVLKDYYYFDENRLRKCSILYPNSSRQVIFVWKDEEAMKELSYIIIGGGLRTNSTIQSDQAYALSDWPFRSGLRLGMRISEIEHINGSDFEIFAGGSEYQGTIVPTSRGKLDFRNTGLQLNCLNCYGDTAYGSEKISAGTAINRGFQMYIVSVLLKANPLPGR